MAKAKTESSGHWDYSSEAHSGRLVHGANSAKHLEFFDLIGLSNLLGNLVLGEY